MEWMIIYAFGAILGTVLSFISMFQKFFSGCLIFGLIAVISIYELSGISSSQETIIEYHPIVAVDRSYSGLIVAYIDETNSIEMDGSSLVIPNKDIIEKLQVKLKITKSDIHTITNMTIIPKNITE
jgi:hypothetical protein